MGPGDGAVLRQGLGVGGALGPCFRWPVGPPRPSAYSRVALSAVPSAGAFIGSKAIIRFLCAT